VKLLWLSNAPTTPSGYGSQTRQVGLRIARAGYEIEFSANDGTTGDREWNGLLVRGSSQSERYSRDTVMGDIEASGADQVIVLYDGWVYAEQGVRTFEGLDNVTGWTPIDHYPTPLGLYSWVGGHNTIAMSQFGRDCIAATSAAMPEAQPRKRWYAPHAVDSVFQPMDGGRFRDLIDVPRDAYLVGIVAANFGTRIYDRKGWSDMSAAAARFMEAHPDAYLYVHTLQKTADGIDLPLRFQFVGIPPDRLRWADQYALKKSLVSDEQMAEIYSSFDVLLGTSRGEGFGLPGIEAQACGVPVILSNWTAQTELVTGEAWNGSIGSERHPSGWLVSVDPDWDPRQGADFAKPRTHSIIGALAEAYERKGDPSLRDAALARAAEFDADLVFDRYWRPILAQMDASLSPTEVPVNRAARREMGREQKKRRGSGWTCAVCHVSLNPKKAVQDVAQNGDVLALCDKCAAARPGRFARARRAKVPA
jgi:glycosyltransferase involved in cell wall biosynthesis